MNDRKHVCRRGDQGRRNCLKRIPGHKAVIKARTSETGEGGQSWKKSLPKTATVTPRGKKEEKKVEEVSR